MRSHGVPSFPDPGVAGGGGGYSVAPAADQASPAFASAVRACAKYNSGTPGPHGYSASARRKLVTLAVCMRAHRVPGFPDPSSTNEATLRLALSSGVDPQAPAFTHAAAVCGAPGLWDRVGLRVAG
ncbi:MAG: hypothetical protein ABSH51_01290 [Solirubrobacteraceae bacterium]|jgi:hypothetical protein